MDWDGNNKETNKLADTSLAPKILPNIRSDSEKKRNVLEWLDKVINPEGDGRPHPNVAEMLEKEELRRIGVRVLEEYHTDKNSRKDWEELNEKGMKLAKQIMEGKQEPWPGAANVKYPLVTTAAMQFGARAGSELLPGRDLVKCKVIGEDPQNEKQSRARRIAAHMSYQLLDEMVDWEEDQDKLVHILPVIGLCWKKTYWDPTEKTNRSDLCLPDDIIIHYLAKSVERARRITHEYPVYQNEIFSNIRSGNWLNANIPLANDVDNPEELDPAQKFLEQHRYLDLDGDGYEEPYIVTVHKETGKVVRIVARFDFDGVELNDERKLIRIKPIQYFTKYGFIPSPDGSLYDLGFGALLYPINESVNTTLNQLLDSGHLANLQGGWMDKSIREKGGDIGFKPGEWRKTETKLGHGRLQDRILPLPTKEPSAVLFNLLGLLIDAGKEIGSVKDVLTGSPPGMNTPATTVLAMIEQGLKVFSAIYKRVYRSMGKEFKKLYRLNSIYLEENTYFNVLDTPQRISLNDYNMDDFDVVPVADPSMASDVQRVARAQALQQMVSGRANVNEDEITMRMITALAIPEPEKIMIPEDQRNEKPDAKTMIEIERVEIEHQRLELDQQGQQLEMMKVQRELDRKEFEAQFDALKKIADAEAAEQGMQLDAYMGFMKEFMSAIEEPDVGGTE